MPAVPSTAYATVETILLLARAIAFDMEVAGGDVLTDDAPFTLQYVSLAYRRIQSYLAQYGVETYADYEWLLSIPQNPTGDPESRIIVSDQLTELFTPTGNGAQSFTTPVLPDNLVAPLSLWERQSGTTDFTCEMYERNDGIRPYCSVGTRLYQWEWINDTLQFPGASQTRDVKMKYEKFLPPITSVNDSVPIRGVENAAAYRVAYQFSKARGSAMADNFGSEGQTELDYLVNRSVRARQRIRHRRRPYGSSGRRGRWGLC